MLLRHAEWMKKTLTTTPCCQKLPHLLDAYSSVCLQPLVLERVSSDSSALPGELSWIHTKALYRLSDTSRDIIKGCTSEMCTTSCLPTNSPDEDNCVHFTPWNSSGTLVKPPF